MDQMTRYKTSFVRKEWGFLMDDRGKISNAELNRANKIWSETQNYSPVVTGSPKPSDIIDGPDGVKIYEYQNGGNRSSILSYIGDDGSIWKVEREDMALVKCKDGYYTTPEGPVFLTFRKVG